MPRAQTSPDRAEKTKAALSDFGREPGRAAMVRIIAQGSDETFGVNTDAPFPAASLLKIPLALAVEHAFAGGRLDPTSQVRPSQVRAEADRGVLHLLGSDPMLTAGDLLALALGVSDNDCASWLLRAVGIESVRAAAGAAGCTATEIDHADRRGIGPLTGTTNCRDAMLMLQAVRDTRRFPRTTQALRHTVHASRIPLGADHLDVRIAHKTGSLSGVAHDAAIIECDPGTALAVFLSRDQHDTLVTGYEMGICARAILSAWGLGVVRTAGLA